jgi:hypothetical protein
MTDLTHKTGFKLSNGVVVYATKEQAELLAIKMFSRFATVTDAVYELWAAEFITAFDSLPSHIKSGYETEQQNTGRNLAENGYDYITISRRGSWGAGTYDGRKSCCAYETLGLHAHTCALVRGMIESGLPIVDYRI